MELTMRVVGSLEQLDAFLKVVEWDITVPGGKARGVAVEVDIPEQEVTFEGEVISTEIRLTGRQFVLGGEDADQEFDLLGPQPEISPEPSPYETVLIEELELRVRAYNALKRSGVCTLADLLARSKSEIMSLPNFGKNSMEELQAELDKRQLKLRGEAPTHFAGGMFSEILLDELELGITLHNLLRRAGISTMEGLLRKSWSDIDAIPNMSQPAINELKEALRQRGWDLDMIR